MLFRLLKLMPACVALGLAAVEMQPAAAATFTYNLTFYDPNNQVVGNGEFTTNTDYVVAYLEYVPYSDVSIVPVDKPLVPPVGGTYTTYSVPVFDFVARFPEKDWSLTGNSWYDGSLGSAQCNRYGSCSIVNSWFAGDIYEGYIFEMRSDGSFWQYGASPERGTWVATAVPEPTTLAGILMAGGGLMLTRKRHQRKD